MEQAATPLIAVTAWQIIAGLLSAGALGAGATLLATFLQTRNENKRSKEKREQDIADRNFANKKEIYTTLCLCMHQMAIGRMTRKKPTFLEEDKNMEKFNLAMTQLEFFSTKEIREATGAPLLIFKKSHPKDSKLEEKEIEDLREVMDHLISLMKEDLGLGPFEKIRS